MSKLLLDAAAIATRIPHHGQMCLNDAVLHWNEQQILCRATSHLNPHNPLREHGRLGTAAGIEYAGQAMALHGALLADQQQPPVKGYITRLQRVSLLAPRLDLEIPELRVQAIREMGNEQIVRYRFEVRGKQQLMISGEATVMLDAG